jgi:hypothetical protein
MDISVPRQIGYGRAASVGGSMATVAVAPTPPRNQRPFPVHRAADGNFFLLYVVLIWLAVLAGFGSEMIRRVNSNAAPFPVAVHIHAIITVAWLGLLTSQTLLIRKRELRLHRKWGTAGGVLAVAVILVGLWAALAFEKLAMNTPLRRPHFLAIEWSNIIEFGGLAAAAIILRKHAAAHKRLILLATLSLTPAAFNRAIGKPFLHPLLGSGVWETWIQIFALTDLMVLGIGLYDWRMRRRVHPAWVLGALWMVAGQVIASWLFYNPAWKAIAGSILTWW